MQCSSGSTGASSASAERSSGVLEGTTADSLSCSALESSALPRFTDTAGKGLGGGYEPLAIDRVAPQKESFHVETERALCGESAGPSQAMLGSEYDLLQSEECEIDEEFGAFVTALDDTERELFTVDAKSVLERFATLQLEQASTEASLIHPGLESLTLEQRYGLGAFMVTMIAEKEDETRRCYGHVNTAQTNPAPVATTSTSSPTGLVSAQAPEWTAPVVTETVNTSVSSAGQASTERMRSKTRREHAAESDCVRSTQDAVDEGPQENAVLSGPRDRDRSRLQSNDSTFAERYARLLLSGLGLVPSQAEALMYLWRACLEGDLIPGQRTELIASTAALVGTPAVRFSAMQAMLTLSLSPGSYDARCRVFLRDAARALRIPWRKMSLVEYAVAALLQQQQQQQEQHGGLDSASVLGSWSDTIPNHSIRPATWELSTEIDADAYAVRAKKRYQRKSRRRAFKVAAMALGGGALFGLAGALAAPLLLPALVGIGLTGASALAATGTVASGAVVGSFFGGLGAGYVGHKARKRTRMRLTDFELEPLGVEEAARAWRQQQTENDQAGGAAERSPDESLSSGSVCRDSAEAPRVSESEPSTPDADSEEAIRLLEAAIRDSLQSTLEQHKSDDETITAAWDSHRNDSDDSERAKVALDSVPASPTDTPLWTSNRDQASKDDSLEQIRERFTQTSLGKECDATAIQPVQLHEERCEHRSWRCARPGQEQQPEQRGGGSSSSFAETRYPQSASQVPAPMLSWPSAHGQGDAASSKVFALAQTSADLPTSTPLQRGQGFRRATPAAILERRLQEPRQRRPELPSTPTKEQHLEQSILPTPRTWNGVRPAEDEPSTCSELMVDKECSVADTEHGSRTFPMATDPLATTSGPRLSHSLHLVIFVPGWLTRSRQEGACASQFYSALGNGRLLPFAERFALRWEPGQLYEMGRAFLKFWTTKAATTAAQQAAPHLLQAVSFAAGALLSSIAWPLFVYSAADIVDGPWSVLLNRANAAGDALADMLALREHGQRPVTLIGYSHGARVIFKCLEALADAGVHGVVDDAFLIGAPCTGDGRRWLRASRAVAGRLVNAYCGTDWALALFHRGSSGQFRVAGLSPIRGCHGRVENVNLALLGLEGHRSLREALPRILIALGVETGGLSFPPILPREVAMLEETDPSTGAYRLTASELDSNSAPQDSDGWLPERGPSTETSRRKQSHRSGQRALRKRRQRATVADEHGRQWKREQYEDPSRRSLDGDDRASLLMSSASLATADWQPHRDASLASDRTGAVTHQAEMPLINIDSDNDSGSETEERNPDQSRIRGAITTPSVDTKQIQSLDEILSTTASRRDDHSSMNSSEHQATETTTEDAEWTAFVGVAPTEPARDSNILVHALGIEVAGGRFLPLIEAGTRYPCERTVTVTTCVDRQESIAFFIYQGSRPRLRPLGAKDARRHHRLLKIIEFHDFTSPVRHRAGGARVELALALDEHGTLEVSIRDIRGDAKSQATIPASMLVRRRDAFDTDDESDSSGSDAEAADTPDACSTIRRSTSEVSGAHTVATLHLETFEEQGEADNWTDAAASCRAGSVSSPTSVQATTRVTKAHAKRSKWWSWRARRTGQRRDQEQV